MVFGKSVAAAVAKPHVIALVSKDKAQALIGQLIDPAAAAIQQCMLQKHWWPVLGVRVGGWVGVVNEGTVFS